MGTGTQTCTLEVYGRMFFFFKPVSERKARIQKNNNKKTVEDRPVRNPRH